ncbi:MAG: hypothetical protein AB8H03_09055 [Saprospiraceae bacterium]
MNWDKFNNRLRNDAEEQNNDIDIDSIWSAIEPQVDEINTEKKKKRRAIFFWWGTGILLLSVGLWFLGNQIFQKENTAQNIDNQTVTSKTKIITKANNPNLEVESPTIKLDNLSENKNDSQSNNANSIINSKSNFSKNKNLTTENKSTTNNVNVVLENKIPPVILSSEVKSKNDHEDSSLQNLPAQKIQNENKEEILDIASLFNLLNFSSKKISLTQVKKVGQPYKTINFEEKENKFSIGIYGGANFTKRNLTAKNDNANTLLQNRKNYETPLETSQVGVNFSYKILNKEKYNLEITSGLQLTSIVEQYKNYSSTISEKDVEGVEFLSYGLGTTPIEIMGFVTETTTTEIQKEIYNTYRMIDIPILISYNRSCGEKWQVGIQGGIFANLSLKTEGIIPDVELLDIDLENNDLNIFKSNVGLSYHLGLNFKRRLSQNWELSFSPAIRYFRNDFANDNYGLSQKYILFGGNIGVNYIF